MKLSDYLDEQKLSHSDMAQRIGTSTEAVRRYANGLRLPKPKIMGRIVEATEGVVEHADFYPDPTDSQAA